MQLIYGSAGFWFVGKALPGPGEVFLCLFTQSDLGAAGPRRFPYFFHPGPDLQASVLRAHTLVWAQPHILYRVAVILWMPWATSLTFCGLNPFQKPSGRFPQQPVPWTLPPTAQPAAQRLPHLHSSSCSAIPRGWRENQRNCY